jgi:hypothetical protein
MTIPFVTLKAQNGYETVLLDLNFIWLYNIFERQLYYRTRGSECASKSTDLIVMCAADSSQFYLACPATPNQYEIFLSGEKGIIIINTSLPDDPSHGKDIRYNGEVINVPQVKTDDRQILQFQGSNRG